jgi:hypothetical protein
MLSQQPMVNYRDSISKNKNTTNRKKNKPQQNQYNWSSELNGGKEKLLCDYYIYIYRNNEYFNIIIRQNGNMK